MGEEKLASLVQEKLAVAVKTKAAWPADATLLHRARENLMRLAK
jgi:hypothetical protein